MVDSCNPRQSGIPSTILLCCGKEPTTVFSQFIADKIDKVYFGIESALPLILNYVHHGASLPVSKPLTARNIMDAIGRIPDKSSDANLYPKTDC